GIARKPGERLLSLFCYDNPALPRLLRGLADQATLILACPGPGSRQLSTLHEAGALPGNLRIQHLPFLPQDEFDQLLRACDLNLVRGEDSFVRAQWAGRPFVWHIYPQEDGAHEAKLQAFMDRAFASMDDRQRAGWESLWRGWNGLAAGSTADGPLRLPALEEAAAAFLAWRSALLTQVDLVTQLQAFLQQ
ncbi:MAG TPA: elongation factor P maturation arginine rhamnosyltransferase EarP, partial [Magnetospirillum sp.]|nr:elongation factor P maturation arginine rhamnosyltransferase EarP [Magnetospirillum sp.]